MTSNKTSVKAADLDAGSDKVPEAMLEDAHDLCALMGRTAKATRLYARNNDVYLRFWDALDKSMSKYLEGWGHLSYQVDSHKIAVDGEVVLEFDDREDNFAFRLYKDGIRRLDFSEGLTSDELQEFLDIITTDFDRGRNVERDAVSMIWESDFEHIKILSVDSFAEEDLADEGEGEEKEDQEDVQLSEQEVAQIAEALQQSAELKLMKLDAEEQREYRQLTTGSAEFEERSALHNGSIFDIDVDDRRELEAEVADPTKYDVSTERVADVIFELFRQETPEAFEELVRVMLGVLDVLLADGDLRSANEILFPLRLLAQEDYARAFMHHDRVLQLFRNLGRKERLEYLKVSLNEGRLEGGPGALFGFLSLQVPENVPGIIEWMSEISDDDVRRAAVDALITVSDGDLKPFIEVVRSGSSELVADVIRGLGRLGDVQGLEVILGAFAHSDPKVREEVLVALRSFDSPRAREIMISALNDPEAAVRMAALRYVAVHRDKLAGRLVIEKINGRSFKQRSFDEMRAMMMTLAHIQGRDSLELLEVQFSQKRLLDVRRAAAHGIGVVGGPDARRLLDSETRGKEAALAEECRRVLAKVR